MGVRPQREPSGARPPYRAVDLRESPGLLVDCDAAYGELGISVKRLRGWEPVEVTEHEYDEQGRLLRATTTREPEWDEQERATLYAWLEDRQDRCSGCGHPLSESTDLDTAGQWAASSQVCLACLAAHNLRKGAKSDAPLVIRTRRVSA